MEMMKKNETITSIELVKKINELRKKEYLEKVKNGTLTKAEKKRGKFTKLEHYNLLKVIRNEFSDEIDKQNIWDNSQQKSLTLSKGNICATSHKNTAVKIYASKYKDESGKENEMFVLALNQAKQVLLRESRFVRKFVIEYIDYLENQNKQLEEVARLQARVLTKITRNIETLSLKTLLEYGKIKKERQKIYYIHYTNLARDIAGLPKGLKRDKLTQGQLGILQQVELIMTAAINECMSENIPFSLIYKEVKDRTEIKAKVLLKALQKVENVEKGITWKIEY